MTNEIKRPQYFDLGTYAMAKLGLDYVPSNYAVFKLLEERGYSVRYTNTDHDLDHLYAILKYL